LNSEQHAARESLVEFVSVKVMAETFLMQADSNPAKEFAALVKLKAFSLNYEKLAVRY
jgi:hypothetical protein